MLRNTVNPSQPHIHARTAPAYGFHSMPSHPTNPCDSFLKINSRFGTAVIGVSWGSIALAVAMVGTLVARAPYGFGERFRVHAASAGA